MPVLSPLSRLRAPRRPGRRRLTAVAATLAVVASIGVAAPAAVAENAPPVPPRPIVSGWYGYWSSDAAVASLISGHGGLVPEVNIFWWSFGGAANPLCLYASTNCGKKTATPWINAHFAGQRDALHAAGIKVYASITDLGSTRARQLSAYLATPSGRQAYADLIATWASNARVDGVDLDWENFAFNDGRATWDTTRPRWVDFIARLSTSLHARGLKLSATVPGGMKPLNNDGSPTPGAGYSVYAWDQIAGSVDRLRVMAYDYSLSRPGPIGPNDWAEQVVASAVAQVGPANAGKVWIGQPQYGRDWVDRTASGGYVTTNSPICPKNWVPNDTGLANDRVDTVRPAVARARAAAAGVTPQWDAVRGEWTYTYTASVAGTYVSATNGAKVARTCTAVRRVWFGDAASAVARASLVPKYKIGGIVVWNLEDVQPNFWTALGAFSQAIAPVPTKVAVNAPRSLTYGVPGQVTAVATSGSAPVLGATATLQWRPAGANNSNASWRPAGTGMTGVDGSVSFDVKPMAAGSWRVVVAGAQTRLLGASAPTAVAVVRSIVAARAPVTNLTTNARARIYAKVAPGARNLFVRVERLSGSRWVGVSLARTDARGLLTAVVPPTNNRGKATYRVVSYANGAFARGYSGPVTIVSG